MTFDFDRVFDRRTSDSNKWRKYPADVLPLWVADMDFPSPPAVVQALRARVEQGFFGYLMEKPELHEVVAERLAKRYDWRVSPDAIVPLPGVIAGFNLALRALTSPGDGLLVQTPVYPPILRAAGNHGLTRDEHALTRGAGGRYTSGSSPMRSIAISSSTAGAICRSPRSRRRSRRARSP